METSKPNITNELNFTYDTNQQELDGIKIPFLLDIRILKFPFFREVSGFKLEYI
jgi:hypothetical protein